MKKIIAARFSDQRSFDKMGRTGQTYLTIKRVIDEANQIPIELSLYVIDGKSKSIIPSAKLVGETFQIVDSPFYVEIEAADKFNIIDEVTEGALPPKNSLKQLRKVTNATKGVSKAGRTKFQGNLLDKKIETETKTTYNESIIKRFNDFKIDESLIPENSLRQLREVRKISKSTDIGEKTRLKGPNMMYDRSALDGKIETYEEYVKSQNDYVQKNMGWVLK